MGQFEKFGNLLNCNICMTKEETLNRTATPIERLRHVPAMAADNGQSRIRRVAESNSFTALAAA
jgi:hypothetical protein